MLLPFTPHIGAGQNLAVTTTSAALTISTSFPGEQLRLCNNGAVALHYRVGASSPTAVVTDTCLPPNAVEIITVGRGVTHIAAITASGSTSLNVTRGEGA